jgi:hypothetical protein
MCRRRKNNGLLGSGTHSTRSKVSKKCDRLKISVDRSHQ